MGNALFSILMLFIACFKGGIGGGDIKLMAALGFTVGYYALVPILFITAISAILLAIRQKEKNVPLGSFLFIGYIFFCCCNF